MQTFLDQLAAELLKNGGNDLSGHCIVLPNRRAGVFLRDAISRQAKKAIWAPTILSIEDLIFQLSGMAKADQTTLLFSFHEVYRRSVAEPQSIELFANWASTFLADINELDLNLIDAQDIFAQLYSVERVAKWNPVTGQATDFQDRHLKFVEQFFPFYTLLRESLGKREIAYQGMAFRSVAERIDPVISNAEWNEVWFAGFNAMTVAEETIIGAWQSSGKAKVFWDLDTFYTNDPVHEAGHYARQHAAKAKGLKLDANSNWISERLSTESKEVHVIAVQRNMSQAQVAGSILRQRTKANPEAPLEHTAVVLNDEQLLLPLLSSIPTTLNGVNITMGHGLQHSQSATFIEGVFKLYQRYSELGDRFHHEDVEAIIASPFMLWAGGAALTELRAARHTNYTAEQLQGSELGKLLFNAEMTTVEGFLTGLKVLIGHLGERLAHLNDTSLEREFLFLLDKMTQRLMDLHAEFGEIGSIRTLHTFWKQLVRGQQLDFMGEPLHGLQIMGMLETRNLDFEEVIMLGVNEGNLPSTSHAPSYFTFDIRRAYGLACQTERDAVTAYHFYRLLQRAKKVYLIYDQDTDSLGRGEMSRYIRQLMMEKGPNIQLKQWNLEQPIPSAAAATTISIRKSEHELAKLNAEAERGFSPSALNTYRSCPLKYYFRYVAGIKEPERLTDGMDAASFGTAVHNTLETLFAPHLNRPLSKENLETMKQQVDQVLREKFQTERKTTEELSGEDLLIFEVARTYVNRALQHDLQTTASGNIITPLLLEEPLSCQLQLTVDGQSLNINMKGLADRIDRLSDGTVRLIDYKTGSFDKKTHIKDMDDWSNPKSDNAFQLLLYLVMYENRHDPSAAIPTLFFLRSHQVEFPVSVMNGTDTIQHAPLADYARELLVELLTEMFDPNTPFLQTEQHDVCQYCDFKEVCQR